MEVFRSFDGFFIREVEAAEKKLDIDLSPESKVYLLHLLKQLTQGKELFYEDVVRDRPLAIVLMEALHENIFQRIRGLKAVGDLSLIFSGLYPEHLTRRSVDLDYFIEMGQRSYRLLSDTYEQYGSKQELFHLYSMLVAEFVSLLEILAELSGELNFMDQEDLAKAMNRWKKTGLRRYREILAGGGVVPLS